MINIALGIFFLGFIVSSEKVDTESNPRNEKHSNAAPATTYLNDSSLLIIGSMLYNVPVPVPRVISLIDNVQNIIRNNREDLIINTFIMEAILIHLVFIYVIII